MADSPAGASRNILDADEMYLWAQRQVLADFAKAWDAWLVRAIRHTERLFVPRSLYDLMVNPSAAIDSKAMKESVGIVYDLARLCRDFIIGDALGWALFERRQGFAVGEVMNRLKKRVTDTEAAAYRRKWLVGLRQIGSGVDAYTGASEWPNGGVEKQWHRDAWKVTVKESIAELIAEIVEPALSQPALKKIPIATPNRDEVERFKLGVLSETGRRITDKQVARVAGYRDTSELKRFKRNDKLRTRTGTEAIRRVLSLPPSTFIDALDKIETRQRTRIAT
ncbi:MAG TPA: hypothetical protein VGQ52_06160 [Gemmatimonadaceae bacterium]|jgi:hypothetical protein|nr:hypothetical protein [Gemmatimonadaceae bacterium]